ncbi:MAG: flagellar filament capping protein FliD [Pseudomonadota bacterium]
MITAQGIGSGLDVASIVSQLVAAEGQPGFLRLSTREASIQSQLSALGSLKSALAEFQSALDPIKDIDDFRSRSTTSSNEALFTATATSSAVPSSYDVEVVRLAQSHKLASEAFTSAEESVGFGTLTIQLGSDPLNRFSINIAEDLPPPTDPDDPVPLPTTTLEAIRDAINNADDNRGVGASIVEAEDGARLVLTATGTGVENEITVIAEGGDGGLSALEFGAHVGAPTMTELQEAVDAEIRVDTFTRTSGSNSISDAIDGVTINLVSASEGSTSQLTIAYDQTVAADKIRTFVESYNTLLDAFNGLSSFDAETNTASTLLGDATLRDVSSALRREMGGGGVQGYGFYRSLSVVGITTEIDGKLSIDDTVLTNSLSSDFDSVGQLFADADGFAVRLDAILEPYTQTGGRIDTRTDGLQESIDLITEQRDRLNLRLASVEERYLRQFSALDSIVSQLTNTSNFLAQQLNSLPNNGL